jgi:hypothetical protein
MMRIIGEVLRRLIGTEIEASVSLAKIGTAIVALNVVKGARRVAMLVCLLILFVVMLACGFLLVPVALCLFMPWSPETKTIVAVSIGAAYLIIPALAIAVLFSQKKWMKASGANKLLKGALKE